VTTPVALRADVVGGLNLFRHPARARTRRRSTDRPLHWRWLRPSASCTRRAHLTVETVDEQLEHALTSRAVIEQAKGFSPNAIPWRAVLSAPPTSVAFMRLRGHVRTMRQPLPSVARAIIDGTLDIN
jgi:hypothetical protein